MKQRLLCVLVVILVAMLLTGCTGNKGDGEGWNSPGKEASSEASAPSEDSSLVELPSDLLNASWPVDSVPVELPEYTSGTVTATGEDGGVLYIKIKDTNLSELYVYLGNLKNSGWIVTSDDTEAEAVLGPCTVNFALQGDDTVLQIDIYTAEVGTWPATEIPPDIMPPVTGTLVDKVEILESTQDAWYFNYSYDGIDETAAALYMEMLRENGWEGDDMMVFKAIEWHGRQYKASVEIYETLETRTTFTCNYWLEY